VGARSLRELSRLEVFSAKGKRVGKVVDVLFHPSEPRAVGVLVARPRLLMVIDRAEKHLALDRMSVGAEGIVADAARDAWDAPAAKRLGIDWVSSVVWTSMPVKTRSGTRLGVVRDGLIDAATGRLKALGITGGLTADIALGVRDIDAGLVDGFDGGAVIVADSAEQVEPEGGAAAVAGRAAAVARAKAGEAARTAAAYGGAAARVAAESRHGKKAVGWLKSIRDEVVDAMGPPDED
jgi:uncharacterized protein YrrD